MPLNRQNAGSPNDWLRHAKSDLELARVNPPPIVMLEGLCFHAQQAVEKSLKAILISFDVPFPRTHNIGVLLDLLPTDIVIPDLVQESAILSDYAVMTRYPHDLEPVDTDEYLRAVEIADYVLSWAERIIR